MAAGIATASSTPRYAFMVAVSNHGVDVVAAHFQGDARQRSRRRAGNHGAGAQIKEAFMTGTMEMPSSGRGMTAHDMRAFLAERAIRCVGAGARRRYDADHRIARRLSPYPDQSSACPPTYRT